VLHHLLRNPDVVLSRSAIPEAVWDSAFDGDVNIVEVYIG
jgi:two-component system OmpR family response regulator